MDAGRDDFAQILDDMLGIAPRPDGRAERRARAWQQANLAFEHGIPIVGHVVAATKGGFIVEVGELQAFLPASQQGRVLTPTDLPEADPRILAIIKCNPVTGSLIVSERALEPLP